MHGGQQSMILILHGGGYSDDRPDMALGIEDPAEWFEFKQLPGSTLKLGSKLVL